MEPLALRRITVFFIVLILLFGCAKENVKTNTEKNTASGFFELCIHFERLPQNAQLSDIVEVSSLLEAGLVSSGNTVLKRELSISKICIFTKEQPYSEIFASVSGDNAGNVAKYLISAFFSTDYASLYRISGDSGRVERLYDGIPLLSKLPQIREASSGIVFKGTSARILYAADYFKRLGFINGFGLDADGNLIFTIEEDPLGKWREALFLFDTLDFEKIIQPRPGDYAVLQSLGEPREFVKINDPDWERVDATKGEKGNSFNFSIGVLNSDFAAEDFLRYLYTLAGSHKISTGSGSFYSPGYRGISVEPALKLFSSSLGFDGEAEMSAESVLLWISSIDKSVGSFPDNFYADLLSLKLAERLYTGLPSFLGGAELVNMTAHIPFTRLNETLFRKGKMSVSGEIAKEIYMFTGEVISESQSTLPLEEARGTVALYGNPKLADRDIVSLVVRGADAEKLIGIAENELKKAGFTPFRRLYEKAADGDSWAAFSISVPLQSEQRVMQIYREKLLKMNQTFSIGVYRDTKKG
ncbi:hypothetical protein J5834_05590 [bacterium]|nr:hypothetical protein [bacterium]